MNPAETGLLRTADGLDLWWGFWPAMGTSRGVVVNVPGLGDHTGLYQAITDTLPGRGFSVYGLDTRGNGRSEGRRGHVDRWVQYRDDLDRFIQVVRAREPTRLTMMGHSLGGLMVLDHGIERPGAADRIVATSPPLGTINTSPVLLALARVIAPIMPTFTLDTGLDLTAIAHDPGIADTLRADPLFHRRASARLGTETLATITRVHANAGRLRAPVLLMHGAEDRMVSIDGSRRLAAAHPGRVRLIEYAHAWHALFADTGHERRLEDLLDWLDMPAG